MNFKNWTDNFAQAILGSVMLVKDDHSQQFLSRMLRQSVRSLDASSARIYTTSSSFDYYQLLCITLNEAKNCMYWYKRSLEYELVNLSNSNDIISQGENMISVLEATLRVIKYQENLTE